MNSLRPLPPGAASGAVVVAAPAPLNATRAFGACGRQVSDRRVRATWLGCLVVADAASTWLSLATELRLNDLIAVGDFLAHRPVYPKPGDRRPFVTLEELASRVDGFHGRGKRRASEALSHLCTGAESRPETLLRMLIHDAGLPPPMVNPEVPDARGDVIGRADLVYPQWRLIVENDGDQHRTDDWQYDRDMVRHERFHLAGYVHLRIRKRALFVTAALTAARVEIALRSCGWAP
ncbi:DUF559 domain-containing protein [Subtercola frigoramans]|uniref:DUF559 domain-containing protein n=1 Tax=Subtercola frigoramans TaxID=120298 RepID=A0ABS2L576_9MICO|nr:DUF559 domain-containing protein [Subtercola frigoramans]MBM7472255.1 hypothetical protein [Subtercola frigoramans]